MSPRTGSTDVHVDAAPDAVFAFLDDHAQLSSHMNERSWRTAGSSMRTRIDERRGREIGSHIEMEGTVLGVKLHLDEVVTRREPPHLKEWETVSTKLLVVGHYRMRAEVEEEPGGSHVRVSIDYDLPERHAWIGKLFGPAYARWCVRQMANDVARHFAA